MATRSLKTPEALQGLYQSLQQSPDYRFFLKQYLEKTQLNISEFARLTGFGRGFPSDVLAKKRRLTSKSAQRFEKAFKLPAQGKKLFKLLVALEEEDVYQDIDRLTIDKNISELRNKNWTPERHKMKELESSSMNGLLADSRMMSIYAAAGEPTKGATLNQIEKRTRLYGQELERHLKKLIDAGFLELRNDVYYPKDLHLFLQTADQSEILKTVFQKACRLASESVQQPQSKDEMFFSSCFCINEADLPQLKTALRELILKYVDEAIQPDGDRVIRLTSTLHF